jgi:hypothetical protein
MLCAGLDGISMGSRWDFDAAFGTCVIESGLMLKVADWDGWGGMGWGGDGCA